MKNLDYKKLVYNPQGEPYGFILFPAKFGDDWEIPHHDKCLFIYFSNFEYIIDSIKKCYPIIYPDTNEVGEKFDVCSMNWIHNKAWNEIISDLQSKSYEDVELKNFVNDFCSWIIENQKDSDEIDVWGTL